MLLHEDHNTPLVCVNTLFRVGSRDEHADRTGFAHLFEHLMFGGTTQIPDYDAVVEGAGGTSNAFTNADYTDYYLTLPAQALDTALHLESDRMTNLNIDQHALQVQQQVVTEEYHQRYINRPYGDAWLLLRPLCFTTHPYRWPTIGGDIRHVQQASLPDVQNFYHQFYGPANAILAIAGNMDLQQAKAHVEHYYGHIPAGTRNPGCYPREPVQTQPRRLTARRNVPSDALYVCYPMPARTSPLFAAYDLMSDILSNGDSSRFAQRMVREKALFTELDASVMGEMDDSLFVIQGKLTDGVEPRRGLAAIEQELQALMRTTVPDDELQKVKNKAESAIAFSHYKAMDRAMSLCHYEYTGHVEWVNTLQKTYDAVTATDILRAAQACFRPEAQNVLFYQRTGGQPSSPAADQPPQPISS